MLFQYQIRELPSGSRLKWTRLTAPVNVCVGILKHTEEGSYIHWPDGTITDTANRIAMHFVSLL